MPYMEDINRDNPGAIVFLIDQSMSMNRPFTFTRAGEPLPRSVFVATAVNKIMEELVSRCTLDDGVRDYFDVGVIGYGRTSHPAFCWEDGLAGRTMVPIAEVAKFARVKFMEDFVEVRGQVVKEIVTLSEWVKPAAYEGTPMKAAILLAHATLEELIFRHPASLPPTVINITDGEANDVDSNEELLVAARRLTSLKTTDGNVMLFNCHIESSERRPLVFPRSSLQLPLDDPYARLLFEMSSEMPARQRAVICELFNRDLSKTPSIRCMAYNADAASLVKFLDIGTTQAFTLPAETELVKAWAA